MHNAYDINQSLFSSKAGEGMIAFAGFQSSKRDEAFNGDGILKIASCAKPGRSGYLTLTFILDLEGDTGLRDQLQARFRRADQETLASRLGPDFDLALEVPLNPFADSPNFYIEEMNLYFRHLGGQERPLLESHVIPTLSEVLDFRFEPLQWLVEHAGGNGAPGTGG